MLQSLGSAWPRKHRTCRRLRLRARSAPLRRSKWPLEPARLCWGARNGRSSPLGFAGALEIAARTRSAPPGRSKLLGLAARKHRTCRRFQLRARSAPLGRSKWPLEPARLRWGARNSRSNSLGSARALEIARPGLLENTAPADVSDFEPARLRWGARHSRSSPFGSAGAPEIAARPRSTPLDRRRFTGQDHECLLHSTLRRTFSCMECTGTH